MTVSSVQSAGAIGKVAPPAEAPLRTTLQKAIAPLQRKMFTTEANFHGAELLQKQMLGALPNLQAFLPEGSKPPGCLLCCIKCSESCDRCLSCCCQVKDLSAAGFGLTDTALVIGQYVDNRTLCCPPVNKQNGVCYCGQSLFQKVSVSKEDLVGFNSAATDVHGPCFGLCCSQRVGSLAAVTRWGGTYQLGETPAELTRTFVNEAIDAKGAGEGAQYDHTLVTDEKYRGITQKFVSADVRKAVSGRQSCCVCQWQPYPWLNVDCCYCLKAQRAWMLTTDDEVVLISTDQPAEWVKKSVGGLCGYTESTALARRKLYAVHAMHDSTGWQHCIKCDTKKRGTIAFNSFDGVVSMDYAPNATTAVTELVDYVVTNARDYGRAKRGAPGQAKAPRQAKMTE